MGLIRGFNIFSKVLQGCCSGFSSRSLTWRDLNNSTRVLVVYVHRVVFLLYL